MMTMKVNNEQCSWNVFGWNFHFRLHSFDSVVVVDDDDDDDDDDDVDVKDEWIFFLVVIL